MIHQQREYWSRSIEQGTLLVQQLRRANDDHFERVQSQWFGSLLSRSNETQEPWELISLSSLRRLCYRAAIILITREALVLLRNVVMKAFIDDIVYYAVVRAEVK